MRVKNFTYICLICLLSVSLFAFASCKGKDDNKTTTAPQVSEFTTTTSSGSTSADDVEVHTVYVTVTDKNGNFVTDKNGQKVTEVSKVNKTKESNKKTVNNNQSVKGGTDPYVEDIF